ncbi:glycosyltransferase [Candidatus Omnitrophota bacterium]
MKILIVYAYAGIGHKKAAESVRDALTKLGKAEVTTVDILDYTDRLFKFLYPRVYLFMINKIPFVWGFLYYFLDLHLVDKLLAPLRRFFHSLHAKKFTEFVLKEKPDAIVSTHFLPGDVISGLKKRGIFKGRLVTIVTDFLPHSFWMAQDSDYFIAALDKTKIDLTGRGIKEERVKVFGIPCGFNFSISKDRQELIKKLNLENGFFNLLIMGGGFGTGPVREITQAIFDLEPRIRNTMQVMIICGKNKDLFEELNRLKKDSDFKLSVFGYMDNIDEFMEVSDCIITKSGGLTVSEAISKKLPMIIIEPIPGQETRNCDVLTEHGAAVRANNVNEVLDYIKDFIISPEKIIGMRARIGVLAYPDAAKKIAKLIIRDED